MGDYPYYPYPPVPQSTYPDLVSASGYPSTAGTYLPDYLPNFNAADDAAFSLAPTTEMRAFANLAVPQSTYPDLVSASGYPSTAGPYLPDYIPDFNAADDAAFSLAPTTEMGAFANPAVPQNVLDPWSMPDLCMFFSCICHYPSYSPDAHPKPSSMRISRSPSRNWLVTHIVQGSLPLPPTRWLDAFSQA